MFKVLTFLFTSLIILSTVANAKSTFEGHMKKCPGSDKQCPQVVDTGLKQCIAKASGKSFELLSDEDYLRITSLSCTKKKIQTITGIENFANLNVLDLTENLINDITPLSKLTSLKKLYLWHNQVTDINPVARLNQLTELHFWGNQVEDIQPLAKLPQLKELLLGDNQIIDISPLKSLRKLNWLELFNNKIDDISPLEDLNELTHLDASGNNLLNIGSLAKLEKLAGLYLKNNNISDIKPLSGLKSLTTLFLGQNTISDISSLSGLTKLKILNLDNNLISDPEPLFTLKNLQRLSILNNCITNFTSTTHIEKVAGLNYQHNLCKSKLLARKYISDEWLEKQIQAQCVDVGDNDYSLKSEYLFFPDGIYYRFYFVSSEVRKNLACKLPWNSSIEDIILTLEKSKDSSNTYETYKFSQNGLIYTSNGLIKGFSTLIRKPYDLIADLKVFNVSFKEKTSKGNEKTKIYIPKNNGYVLQVIEEDDFLTVGYFEPSFFEKEIMKK